MAQTEIDSPPVRVDGTARPREATTPSATPIRRAIVAGPYLLAALLLYVLSYAPMLRLRHGPDAEMYATNFGEFVLEERFTSVPPSHSIAFYKPVEYLLDKTSTSKPLLWWADLWRVKRRSQWHSVHRYLGDWGR